MLEHLTFIITIIITSKHDYYRLFKLFNVAYKQTNCLALCYDIDYKNNNPCNCTNTRLGRVFMGGLFRE